MSRFHGRQHRGAMRELRALRRAQAEERQRAEADRIATLTTAFRTYLAGLGVHLPLTEDEQRARACTGKRRYSTRPFAKWIARRLRRLGHGRYDAYHCRWCGQWHLGHPDGTGTGLRAADTERTRT